MNDNIEETNECVHWITTKSGMGLRLNDWENFYSNVLKSIAK